jgi:hypothetical protein
MHFRWRDKSNQLAQQSPWEANRRSAIPEILRHSRKLKLRCHGHNGPQMDSFLSEPNPAHNLASNLK